MTRRSFYSDRTRGRLVRDREVVDKVAWRGLLALIDSRIENNWLANEFLDQCPDGNGISGTNQSRLNDVLAAFIPDLSWPPEYVDRDVVPETYQILDLIDFIGQRIAKPKPGPYHSYYRHNELNFDVPTGREEFRHEVNLLFARSGLAYEVSPDMEVERIGPPEARQTLVDLDPDSGDEIFDNLVIEARRRFLSRNRGDQSVGLEKLWDAFERLKTLEPGKDKKSRMNALLDRLSSGSWRGHLDAEAMQLTGIGNSMTIRHFETGKEPLPDGATDYLFTRMASLMLYILRSTGRLRE